MTKNELTMILSTLVQYKNVSGLSTEEITLVEQLIERTKIMLDNNTLLDTIVHVAETDNDEIVCGSDVDGWARNNFGVNDRFEAYIELNEGKHFGTEKEQTLISLACALSEDHMIYEADFRNMLSGND